MAISVGIPYNAQACCSLRAAGTVTVTGHFAWEGERAVETGRLVLGPTSRIATGLGYPQTFIGEVVNGPGDTVLWEGWILTGIETTFVNSGTFEIDALSDLENPTEMLQGGGATFVNAHTGSIISTGDTVTMGWSYINDGSLPGELTGRECIITEPREPPIPSKGVF
jgi:hypothetical protein